MIHKVVLENFKNFRQAALAMGPFSLLVGTNASGKSNIRDAFRFLHGLSRGYSLADIIGEKWVEGGILQWKGIRGGTKETAFAGTRVFEITAIFDIDEKDEMKRAIYKIAVDTGNGNKTPRVIAEAYNSADDGFFIFSSQTEKKSVSAGDINEITVRFRKGALKASFGPEVTFDNSRPVLSQIPESGKVKSGFIKKLCGQALSAFSSMRFLDLNPDQMKIPSIPGQSILGDRGENLSSVLQKICGNFSLKQALIEWIKTLTPMDAVDFEFPQDQTGRILVSLVEANGQRTSAYSASDGTLRFLAIIAALIGPEPARFYFFEELENGLHPTRLHLLIQLLESRCKDRKIQVVATTHSPQLLSILSDSSLAHASLIYRLESSNSARIKRIVDIPKADDLIKKQDKGRLFASGWLEDAVSFTESPGDPSE